MTDVGRPYRLAASAEMLFQDLPFVERVETIAELGYEVEIWDWTTKDVDALVATGATFSSMTGYIEGSLTDPTGSARLLATAEESVAVAHRLSCPRLNLHGTGLDASSSRSRTSTPLSTIRARRSPAPPTHGASFQRSTAPGCG